MPIPVGPSGPPNAKIMIVGEAPGEQEEANGKPFVGPSGYCLDRMLQDAGLLRSEAYVTNVSSVRPRHNNIELYVQNKPTKRSPDPSSKKALSGVPFHLRDRWVTKEIIDGCLRLKNEIASVKPHIILPVGNVSLWALTGEWGIKKWRGSMLFTDFTSPQPSGTLAATKVIPAYHPAFVLRDWKLRNITVKDFRTAKRFLNGEPYPLPKYNFILRPTYEQVLRTLDYLSARVFGGESFRISFDLETRSGHIACAGLAWTYTDAICIPFMVRGKTEGYWNESQEAEIIWRLRNLLQDKRARIIGQNLLYDSQYTYRHWLFVPTVEQDTMISFHSMFSDMPKNIAYQASMLCDYYSYWKDEK